MYKYIFLFSVIVFLYSCKSDDEVEYFIKDGSCHSERLICNGACVSEESNLVINPGSSLVLNKTIKRQSYEVYARFSLDTIAGTEVNFYMNNICIAIDKKYESDWAITLMKPYSREQELICKMNDVVSSRDIELKIIGETDSTHLYINGHKYSLGRENNGEGYIGLSSGKNTVRITDFYLRGDVSPIKTNNYLYKRLEQDYAIFRIPALAVTKRGTVLAFAEGRRNSGSDAGDIDIVVKRSVDGGKTWGELIIVLDDSIHTTGNVTPVVDYETGDIFVLSTWNRSDDTETQIINGTSADTRRILVTKSVNDGLTWEKPTEITKQIKLDNWTWYATGPCHGIQIQKGAYKGRLLASCDHIEATTKSCFSHVIFSDDHGKTWQLGGSTPVDGLNECTVAELENGDLMLNMRNYKSPDRVLNKVRKVSISKDGGLTWGRVVSDSILIEPICQGSLLRYSFDTEGQSRLLFINPADSLARRNMTLRMSYDDGKSWPLEKILYEGHSAYSDVVRLPDGNIGCLYEAGYFWAYDGIVFEIINLNDLK